MKKRTGLYGAMVGILLSATIIAQTGCESAGAEEGGTTTPADPADGHLTVSITGADTIAGEVFYAYLFAAGECSIYTETALLAVNHGAIATDGGVSFILEEDDGQWEPNGTDWQGSGGMSYDLYLYTDNNNDGDWEPATSSSSYRHTDYPVEITLDGDHSVDLDFANMVDFTGGTLTVTVENAAAENGKEMFFGVFVSGANPEADESISWGGEVVGASTSGEATDLAVQDDSDTPWYGVDGQQYDLYVMIDQDSSGSEGPTTGDLFYQETYTQNGDRSVVLDRATDFTPF